MVNSQKKLFDAIAAASIFTNCAGIDTNNSQVITLSTFTKFLETRQMENKTVDEIKALIDVSFDLLRLNWTKLWNLAAWTWRDTPSPALFVIWGIC